MRTPEPKVLHVRRRGLDIAGYNARHAQEGDYSSLITEPTLLYDDDEGAVTLAYLRVEQEDTTALVGALRRLDVPPLKRTGGMPSYSRTFGYHPRNARRNNFCGPHSLATDDPAAHALIVSYAAVIAGAYERSNPALFERHKRLARAVRPDWLLEGGPFTSGIVNRDSPLPYHYDGGNFAGVWSGMLGFRRDVAGSYLAVPEYDLAVEVADGSLTLFDGQGLLHGVTPFVKTSPHAYRFTVVYYSLEQMWKCLPPEEEAARIQQLRIQRR
jgi:hypothetical protein